jgi:hypothetical protein
LGSAFSTKPFPIYQALLFYNLRALKLLTPNMDCQFNENVEIMSSLLQMLQCPFILAFMTVPLSLSADELKIGGSYILYPMIISTIVSLLTSSSTSTMLTSVSCYICNYGNRCFFENFSNFFENLFHSFPNFKFVSLENVLISIATSNLIHSWLSVRSLPASLFLLYCLFVLYPPAALYFIHDFPGASKLLFCIVLVMLKKWFGIELLRENVEKEKIFDGKVSNIGTEINHGNMNIILNDVHCILKIITILERVRYSAQILNIVNPQFYNIPSSSFFKPKTSDIKTPPPKILVVPPPRAFATQQQMSTSTVTESTKKLASMENVTDEFIFKKLVVLEDYVYHTVGYSFLYSAVHNCSLLFNCKIKRQKMNSVSPFFEIKNSSLPSPSSNSPTSSSTSASASPQKIQPIHYIIHSYVFPDIQIYPYLQNFSGSVMSPAEVQFWMSSGCLPSLKALVRPITHSENILGQMSSSFSSSSSSTSSSSSSSSSKGTVFNIKTMEIMGEAGKQPSFWDRVSPPLCEVLGKKMAPNERQAPLPVFASGSFHPSPVIKNSLPPYVNVPPPPSQSLTGNKQKPTPNSGGEVGSTSNPPKKPFSVQELTLSNEKQKYLNYIDWNEMFGGNDYGEDSLVVFDSTICPPTPSRRISPSIMLLPLSHINAVNFFVNSNLIKFVQMELLLDDWEEKLLAQEPGKYVVARL